MRGVRNVKWFVSRRACPRPPRNCQRLMISEGELWKRKARLKAAWEDSGGSEGARARLKFAQDFLAKERAGRLLDRTNI